MSQTVSKQTALDDEDDGFVTRIPCFFTLQNVYTDVARAQESFAAPKAWISDKLETSEAIKEAVIQYEMGEQYCEAFRHLLFEHGLDMVSSQPLATITPVEVGPTLVTLSVSPVDPQNEAVKKQMVDSYNQFMATLAKANCGTFQEHPYQNNVIIKFEPAALMPIMKGYLQQKTDETQYATRHLYLATHMAERLAVQLN